MANFLATEEPMFYVGFCVNSVLDEFEIVCILTNEDECREYLKEELKKPHRRGVSNQQHLTMRQIEDIILEEKVKRLSVVLK